MNKTLLVAGALVSVTIFGVVFTMQPKEDSISKKAFMDSCAVDSSYKKFCECGYDELRKNYSHKRLEEISDEYTTTGVLPDELMEITYTCLDKL